MADSGPWEDYQAKPGASGGPWEDYAKPGSAGEPSATPKPPTAPTMADKAVGAGTDLLRGIGSGVLNTVGGISRGIHAIPGVGPKIIPTESLPAMRELGTPPSTLPGKIGHYGEQAAEFMLPGDLEEKAGAKALELAPKLGEWGPRLARTGVAALSSGTVNAAQGGGFKSGAELGAGGNVIGEAGRALAPNLAETALRVSDRMRGRGRTIGEAALNETTGIRPITVARSAERKLDSLTGQMEGGVHAATTTGTPVSRGGAQQALQDVIAKAPRNAVDVVKKLNSLGDLLELPGKGSAAYTPDELLEMKRGIGEAIKTWPPEWQRLDSVKRAQQSLYRELDKELDRAVPGNEKLNQRISSLIPVKQQALRLSQGAPMTQRLAGRMAAHTGALTGAALGYREGGIPGAVAGFAIPEIISSPTGQMAIARGLRSGVLPRLGRAAVAPVTRRNEGE